MKRNLLVLLVAVITSAATLAQNAKPFTIPEITEWTGAAGETTFSGRVVVRSKLLTPTANQFAKDYETLFGQHAVVATGRPKPGDIVLSLRPSSFINLRSQGGKEARRQDESYRLTIGTTISVEAPTTTGLFWATRTLLQMMETSPHHPSSTTHHPTFRLPRGTATDTPQYALRGFMIDAGRKYIPMSYLRSLVQLMAYYKMNTLQIHLNDNGFRQYFNNDWRQTPAAFRLECDTYPGLTATDGSYTKDEFIALQQLAEQLHVEIIPEIDAPAHSLAFSRYRPSLGSTEYGMDHLDLANPEVYDFMDGLFREYLTPLKSGRGAGQPVFRGPHVNIGTDEYSNARQEVVEQFRQFTDHYLALVESYGKLPMLWGALTHAQGQTPVRHKGVLMNCWYNGYAYPDSMMRLGYDVVSIPDGQVYIVPAAGYYYDYLDCQRLYDHWTPATIGSKTFAEQHPQIRGGMFAVWNDHHGNGISVKDIHHRVFPAMQTLAVKTWTGQLTTLPYADFDARRLLLSEAPGINELGRLPAPQLSQQTIAPDSPLALQPSSLIPRPSSLISHPSSPLEAGYNYRVTFTIDCQPEAQGTAFTTSPNATFYLSDPRTGHLGFSRDGYLNTFSYALPTSGRHRISIEGTNRETRLYVDGQLQQTLATRAVYAVWPGSRLDNMPGEQYPPAVNNASAKMFYVPTLVFPLERTGHFRSRISNLSVEEINFDH